MRHGASSTRALFQIHFCVVLWGFTAILGKQAAGQLQWPGVPYPDIDKVFQLGLVNMLKGTWTPAMAHTETVKATKDLITKWLSS